MLIIPTSAATAHPLLQQMRVQRSHCTMFVVTGGETGSQIASKADVRAENHPFRKVVWIQDAKVLTGAVGYEPVAEAVSAGAIVCTMTFDFKSSSTFSASDTVDFLRIERAFIKAEIGN